MTAKEETQAAANTEETAESQNTSATAAEKKGKGKVIGLISAVVLIIVAAALLIWGRNMSGDNSSSKDANNLFSNGLAAVMDSNGKWGYIDKSGSYVINAQFDAVGAFEDNGLALVRVGDGETGKYGYINKSGEYAIDPQFDDALAFADNDLAAVKKENRWGYIDKEGKTVIDFQYRWT